MEYPMIEGREVPKCTHPVFVVDTEGIESWLWRDPTLHSPHTTSNPTLYAYISVTLGYILTTTITIALSFTHSDSGVSTVCTQEEKTSCLSSVCQDRTMFINPTDNFRFYVVESNVRMYPWLHSRVRDQVFRLRSPWNLFVVNVSCFSPLYTFTSESVSKKVLSVGRPSWSRISKGPLCGRKDLVLNIGGGHTKVDPFLVTWRMLPCLTVTYLRLSRRTRIRYRSLSF